MDVKTKLRQEVGFCCPVNGCGSPYLTWHHFDPPWRVEHHHRPEGMIALCREHADKADNGAFTDDQLRELKRVGRSRAKEVRGRFDWMRRDLLAVVGGNFFYQEPVLFQVAETPCVWFDRDEEEYLLLNFRMPTVTGLPRARIDQNFWTVVPAVEEVVCPPSGRLVEVKYANGDKFRCEFFNLDSPHDAEARYPQSNTADWTGEVKFPLIGVELWVTAPGTDIEFSPCSSKLRGFDIVNLYIRGSGWTASGTAAIHLDVSPDEGASLFPEPDVDPS